MIGWVKFPVAQDCIGGSQVARTIGWQDAVQQVMKDLGGRASIDDLYRGVTKLKKTNLDDRDVKHRIRGALAGLKENGKAEHIGDRLWRLLP